MVTIRVPATTANLGPGFDAFGCALGLYAHFAFEKREGGFSVEGCPERFRSQDNLVFRGYRAGMVRLGLPVGGLHVHVSSEIPVARGLGSSAACIAAGAAAAGALHGLEIPRRDLVDLTAAAEGHPDNAAPAVYGGMRVAVLEEGRVHSLPVHIHPGLRFFAMVPEFELSTAEARRALPMAVAIRDAVYNLSRAALLVKALEAGDLSLIRIAMQDRLHQRFRFPLIAQSDRVLTMANEEGAVGFYLSGAGPTLMCLYTEEDFPPRMESRLASLEHRWQGFSLGVDPQGLALCEGDQRSLLFATKPRAGCPFEKSGTST